MLACNADVALTWQHSHIFSCEVGNKQPAGWRLAQAGDAASPAQEAPISRCARCRLGAIARGNGCPTVCKDLINTLYGYNAMEVQEAFNKICEQARPAQAPAAA